MFFYFTNWSSLTYSCSFYICFFFSTNHNLFVWFDSLRPRQHLPAMSGWVFLGWTSTKQRIRVLLNDTTQCRRCGSKQQRLNLESIILPLSHCTPTNVSPSQGRETYCFTMCACLSVKNSVHSSTPPPTILVRSFWNFADVFVNVWRCAWRLAVILRLIFVTFLELDPSGPNCLHRFLADDKSPLAGKELIFSINIENIISLIKQFLR